MTAELRWIFLLLHFTAEVAGIKVSYVTVRDGDDVTLPCDVGTGDQRRRDDTTWTFIAAGRSSSVTVFERGKFPADVSSKSDRLRVREKCSLVIEKVSVDDAGQYYCRQYREGRQQGEAALVHLSVVTMTEQKVSDDDDDDEVTLTCSVKSHDGWCDPSPQWLFDGEDKNMETSQSDCSDSVKIKTSEFNQKIKSQRCKVRDHRGNTEKLFEFKTQRSTDGDTTTTATTTTTTTTTKPTKSSVYPTTTNMTTPEGTNTRNDGGKPTPTPPPPPTTTTTNMMTSEGENNKRSTTDTQGVWWVYLLVGVASVFLVVVVVWFLIRQKKKKTSETEPETDQNQADPEGVAYVSVSFTKTTRTRDQVKGHDDDDDAVTYSTVRAPPPSSSSDPRDLYATVNKPKK